MFERLQCNRGMGNISSLCTPSRDSGYCHEAPGYRSIKQSGRRKNNQKEKGIETGLLWR